MAKRRAMGRGGWRPGAGRRKLPPEKQRRNASVVRFTDEEMDALLEAAGDAPLATWIHDEIVALARRRARREERT